MPLNPLSTVGGRLMLAMVFVVVGSLATAAYFVNAQLTDRTLRFERSREQWIATDLATRIESYIQHARNDVLAISDFSSMRAVAKLLAEGDGTASVATAGYERATRHLQQDFVSELRANQSYCQIRLIAIGDGGRECVRVDRDPDGAIRAIGEDALQVKGERDYFQRAIELSPGAVHTTQIELNQERGVIQTPYTPVLRVATPVCDDRSGEKVGVAVINVDMRPIFRELRTRSTSDVDVYVINDAGDYLLHPDPSREFGGELSRPDNFLRDYPGIGDLDNRREDDATATVASSAGARRMVVCADVATAGAPLLRVVRATHATAVAAQVGAARRSVLIAAVPAVGVSLIVAILMARTFSKPIRRFATALAEYSAGETPDLSEGGVREFALLRDAFREMATDVTAKRKALTRVLEERTRAWESLVRLIEMLPSGMLIVGVDGRIQDANVEAERMFGYGRGELSGLLIEALVPEKYHDQHVADREAYSKAPTAREMGEERGLVGRRSDGAEFPVEIGLRPIELSSGPVVLCSLLDDSLRKVTERTLRQYETIVTNSDDAIISVSSAGIILSWNPGAERLYGYGADEILGEPISCLAAGAEAQGAAEVLDALANNEIMRSHRCEHRHRNGDRVDVAMTVSPIRNADGDVIGAAIISRDISEEIEAEKLLTQYASDLLHTNKELERFAYVVSHDVRAPLRGISNVAQWLAEDFGHLVDDDARENIRLMIERTDRLSRMIDGILKYSRAGRTELTYEEVDVNAIVAESIDALAPPSSIRVRVDGPLPSIVYDESQLRQVFQNLIGNAATHLGRPDGEIVISCRPCGEFWEFGVRDNGVGIAKQHSDRIFELFQTLKPKDECGTTGVGLAIVKSIVERNGGRVRMVSQEGQGAEFLFTIPATRSIETPSERAMV